MSDVTWIGITYENDKLKLRHRGRPNSKYRKREARFHKYLSNNIDMNKGIGRVEGIRFILTTPQTSEE